MKFKVGFTLIAAALLTSLTWSGNISANIPVEAVMEDLLEWSEPIVINDDNQPAVDQNNPDMVVLDGLGIFVVWEDYRNDHQEIYFSHSTDGGVVWSTNTQVSDASMSLNTDPHIAVDAGGTIYVVWRNVSSSTRGIYFARSTDNGVT